ncbi:hypothetical protein QQS21_003032 [Conoideocrella luteorostrata]|uniref:Mid2 domain-containing protein n=1 Tax=Conoideocrella luteorostrata TaxID=1105319 RepID=A0AAJ0FVZ6_9HYPO|nr:hypothetical protein QQS21_003032 [Conoideocrella luteorostrata]
MYTKQALQQLLVAIAMLSMAQATWLDTSKFDVRAVAKRQVADVPSDRPSSSSAKVDSQSTSASQSAPSVASTTSSSPVSTTPSSTPVTTSPSSTPPSSTPVATTPSSSAVVQTTPSSISRQSTSTSFQYTPSTSSSSYESTATTPVISTKVEVVTSTRSDGSKATMTSTTTTTSTPGLSSGDSETSGMTPKTRNTVIGVVVGVGGAIVLGALGLVAYRIWGRKKQSEENDGLMDYDMSATPGAEKSERGSSAGGNQRTPFQSTLENYHQPGQVNASSNF